MKRILAGLLTAALVAGVTTSPLRAQGQGESITVRGHWVLEARNPDGTVGRRLEFDNALVSGQRVLVSLLTRNISMGRWGIQLETRGHEGTAGPFNNQANAFITELDWTWSTGTATFKNLQLNPPSTGTIADLAAMTLSGTATATHKGWIWKVSTWNTWCLPNVAADACVNATFPKIFSGTALPGEGLFLDAGQILQVSVTISFASAPHPPQ